MTNPLLPHHELPEDDRSLRLERYADNVMPPQERDAFERELGLDAELRDRLASARALDSSLKRLFTPPATLPRSSQIAIPWWRRPVDRRWALAAAVLFLAGLLAVEFRPFDRRPRSGPPVQITLANLYRETVANGFTPYTVCTTPEQFAFWTTHELGAALHPGTLTPGVELLGWSYRTVAPGYAGLLLARVNGTNVLLLMSDARIINPTPTIDPLSMDQGDTQLRVFRRDIGPIKVLEITPLDAPAVIEALRPAPVGS